MSLICHCYTCNVKYPTKAYIFSSNNEDEQNIIIQICKRILEAIQHKHTSTEISYDDNIMLHKQIRNINEIENLINKEFIQLFEHKILRKEIKKLPIGIWRIGFKWDEFNNDSLIKNILKISREWYYNFTKYFQKIDDQKRDIGTFNSFNPDLNNKNEDELKQCLLDNLKNYLLGFEYLIDYSWNLYDNYEGNFIFASNSGIFIVVETKYLNVKKNEYNDISISSLNNDVKDQSLKYKDKVAMEFNGKYITLLGATLICDLDANSLDKVTFEFNDNDEIIARHIKEVHDFSPRRYNEFNGFNNLDKYEVTDDKFDGLQTLSSQNNQDTTSILQGTITKVAAAAAVGYMIYRTFSRGNHSN
ncbi:uncharacterized protein OCT59_028115 [Rhizophagus irregularis]|uniref:Uncharacterized protein n=2 Tax=Rhizophagus irregularis TaxID=588596 RepID=A0A015LIU7_RHIIW|nr:hypothetical protein GLOIN_2v1470999 [Rhizophagus irregularis DAOM 181602=DAOM 197198]EXX54733.1 hypothetical protein RirG_231720 [Rhizophagus irregularis DAOM 197198w]UZO07843.1 hypothetical protein OCT59_028115 [Rhizophagus irregularis]POG81034.1 hypothetical protein GLOIN_2v1470999 [Rhizophagus irregularis DAOM 181602=DAOM 197198]CAG8453785.1 14814_t:CDS:2 [Rhizophagus irregularis]GET65329.1 hypothetical protein GLOIN_2v1470999 [Rhizophagus irregularis DAOM 181602=DAOM 197198]|eukprot:XP_025187900.1 hypothetical protein GLOIN_2v1470999 [Rhizophagus irregularis DAOM 181602=DAOM 197198]